jgi:DNA-binding response OmpR family regulator
MAPAEEDELSRLWSKKTILVVDDDEAVRELIQYDLGEDYHITAASNAEECLTILEADDRPTPDLITLDIMMPGVTGLDLLDRLKADPTLADIPVIMLTSVDQEDEVVAALDRGADDYLKKPFSLEELAARIKRTLEA